MKKKFEKYKDEVFTIIWSTSLLVATFPALFNGGGYFSKEHLFEKTTSSILFSILLFPLVTAIIIHVLDVIYATFDGNNNEKRRLNCARITIVLLVSTLLFIGISLYLFDYIIFRLGFFFVAWTSLALMKHQSLKITKPLLITEQPDEKSV